MTRDLRGDRIHRATDGVGPHPGIPYVLKVSGTDVYFRMSPRPNVTRDVLLSTAVGREAAAAFAARSAA